jgi:hypothetical protein
MKEILYKMNNFNKTQCEYHGIGVHSVTTCILYDLELSWRLSTITFSRATSHVRWLKGEKNQCFESLRVLIWLEFQLQPHQYADAEDGDGSRNVDFFTF